MFEPQNQVEFLYKVLVGTWALTVLILFTILVMMTGCSLNFQNVTLIGDTSDFSDEINQPTTIPVLTYRF